MSKLRVAAFSISVDGFGAGPDQSLEHPLGRGGEELHKWFVPTRSFQRMSGKDGTTGIDDDFGTVRQYLKARLIDEMHLAISPTLLGSGESLFEGLNLPELGYRIVDSRAGEAAYHVIVGKDSA